MVILWTVATTFPLFYLLWFFGFLATDKSQFLKWIRSRRVYRCCCKRKEKKELRSVADVSTNRCLIGMKGERRGGGRRYLFAGTEKPVIGCGDAGRGVDCHRFNLSRQVCERRGDRVGRGVERCG